LKIIGKHAKNGSFALSWEFIEEETGSVTADPRKEAAP